MNIYLLGYRYAGKTTVGKALAKILSLQFMDMNVQLEKESGMSIREMVKEKGWPEFRRQERILMGTLSGLIGFVVATCGTTVIDPENLKYMKQSGPGIWLKAHPRTIAARAFGGKARDRSDSKYVEQIAEVLEKRTPYYEAAMAFSIGTDDVPVDMVCELIIERLGEKGLIPRT